MHTVVEHFNGSIDIQSRPEKDTELKVSFPAGSEPRAARPGEGRTVLVCDDEELMRKVAGRILESVGFNVLYAESGGEARDIIGDNPARVDLVMMDLSMPGESGLDIFLSLKELRPDIRVLFSSGYGDDERLRQAEQEGAVGFLQKPFTMDKMLRKIYAALGSDPAGSEGRKV